MITKLDVNKFLGVGDGPWAIPESSQTISEISEIHENLEVGPEIRSPTESPRKYRNPNNFDV